MRIDNEVVKAISTDNLSGVSAKNNKPYSMSKLTFQDDDGTRFSCILDRSLEEEGKVPAWLVKAAEAEELVVVSLELKPTLVGFGYTLKILDVKEND